ncbi:MAG: hypothetical protein AAFY17_16915, partial [Cyanobacteria bacterium J06642_11]
YTQRPVLYTYNPDSDTLQQTGQALVIGHPEEIATTLAVSQSGEILQTEGTYQLARVVFNP